MGIFEIERMTCVEIDSLDRKKTIVFLPLSPIEEHGPHLPVGTDFFAVMDISRLAIPLVEKADPSLNCLLHPGIPLGCVDITRDFPGTISLKGNTLREVVYAIAASFAQHGFRYLIIVNHHYDLYHMKAISLAINKARKKLNILLFEPLGTSFFASQPEMASPLSGEKEFNLDREGHAEFEETSYILYRYPELVKGSWRDLPPVYVDLVKQYLLGRRTLKKMGAKQGYVGTPAKATVEYGQSYLEVQAQKVAEGALKLYRGDDLPQIALKIRLAMRLLKIS
jgi:creatinine amidohydrolase